MAQPANSESVVALPEKLTVETSKGDAYAMAMSWTGLEMVYLVVSLNEESRPFWISENEINNSYF